MSCSIRSNWALVRLTCDPKGGSLERGVTFFKGSWEEEISPVFWGGKEEEKGSDPKGTNLINQVFNVAEKLPVFGTK